MISSRLVSKVTRSMTNRVSRVSRLGTAYYGTLQGRLELGFTPPPYDGMQNYQRTKFLYDSIQNFAKPSDGVALEVGCYKCCSTVFLAKACLKRGIKSIYAIDLFTGTPAWHSSIDTYHTAKSRLKHYKLDHSVTLIRSHSLEYNWNRKIDVLHLDADHEYETVMADIVKYASFVNDGGIMIFDDYDVFHPGVKKAVNQWLLENGDYEIVDINYQGEEYGSICLRKWKLAVDIPVEAKRMFDAGRRELQEGNRGQARAYFEEALSKHGYFPLALHELALLDLDEQQPERAILRLRRALEIDPSYAEGYVTYSRTLNLLGRHEEALEKARRALELKPNLWQPDLDRS